MTRPVRFAIIGLGVVGARHVQTFRKSRSRDFALTAAMEVNPEVARSAKSALPPDVPIYSSMDELVAAKVCDAVLIAVPHCWHPVLTIQAARAGLHVLCEKPLAVTVGPARAMIAECDLNQVALGAMLQDRTSAMNVAMKRMISAGRLGRIHRISQVCTRWYRTQAYYDSGAWRGTWDGEGGGILINQACHALDVFQWLGGMPTSVLASVGTRIHQIEVENTAEALLQYADGAMGHFYVSTAHEPGMDFIEIFGDKGTLVARDGKLRFARLEAPLSRHIQRCKIAEADIAKIRAAWTGVKLPAKPGGSHAEVIAAFAAHLLGGKPMVATGAEALNELELSNAMYVSAYSSKAATLPVDAREIEKIIARLEKDRSTGKGNQQRKKADAALRKLLKK